MHVNLLSGALIIRRLCKMFYQRRKYITFLLFYHPKNLKIVLPVEGSFILSYLSYRHLLNLQSV
jgi:hypothetical protein